MKKLLPREPTPEIKKALSVTPGLWGYSDHLLGVVYAAIYNAATALPEPGEVELELRAMERGETGDVPRLRRILAGKAADLIAAQSVQNPLAESESKVLSWMNRAIDAEQRAEKAEAERDSLVRAIDECMVASHIGVFNLGDDPKKAINAICVYEQGVGEYFGTEKLKAENKRLQEDAERYRWLRANSDAVGKLADYATEEPDENVWANGMDEFIDAAKE